MRTSGASNSKLKWIVNEKNHKKEIITTHRFTSLKKLAEFYCITPQLATRLRLKTHKGKHKKHNDWLNREINLINNEANIMRQM